MALIAPLSLRPCKKAKDDDQINGKGTQNFGCSSTKQLGCSNQSNLVAESSVALTKF